MSKAASSPSTLPTDLANLVSEWGRLWGVPELAERVSISFSRRMQRSLGRCQPARARVRIAGHLEDAPRELLEEVLCHEVAHAAAYLLLGPKAKPHGPEWSEMVRQAGFEPRTRAPAILAGPSRATSSDPTQAPSPAGRGTTGQGERFEHRCPVCQTTRVARRPVPSWHCAECLDAGLPGAMLISRVPAPRPGHA